MFKNKKLIGIILVGIILVAVVGISLIFGFKKDTSKNNVEHQKVSQTLYIKLDTYLKIIYQKEYDKCDDKICSDVELKVVDYEVLDKDNKTYDNLEIKDKSLEEALDDIYNLVKEENREEIKVYSNDADLKKEDLGSHFKDKVDIVYNETLDEDDVLNNNVVKECKVMFDSNGGSLVKNQAVKENGQVIKPEDPVRDGYTFKEWTYNDKAYDFQTKVNEDITLKASWEKKKTSSGSSTNKPASNSGSSNNKIESTVDKINLNEYPTSIIDFRNYTQPIYYYYFTNLGEVFPELAGKTEIKISWEDEDAKEVGCDIRIDEWAAKFSQLTFDTAKENNAKTILENINNKNYRGVKFEGSVGFKILTFEENHGINYRYEYISFNKNPFANLYNGLESVRKSLNQEITSFTRDAIEVIYPGYGVYGKYEAGLLTEEMCVEYNLVCDRW